MEPFDIISIKQLFERKFACNKIILFSTKSYNLNIKMASNVN